MESLLAPCGHYCSTCEAYLATQAGDQQSLVELAEKHSHMYGKVIEPMALKCDGCMSEGIRIGFCAICAIRNCATSKNLSSCADCADFPCPKGSFIWTEGSKSLENLLELKNKA